MAQILPDLCQDLAQLSCEPWQKIIRFDNNPNRKLDYLRLESRYDSGQQLNLPSPSLIGFPTDSDSARFVSEAYKKMIAQVYLADMLEYTCCEKIVLFDALMGYQLAELGVSTWAVDGGMHTARFQDNERNPTLFNLQDYWGIEGSDPLPAEEEAEVRLMLDFVAQLNTNYTTVDLLQSLLSAQFTVGNWLNEIMYGNSADQFDRTATLSEFNELWEQYAYLNEDAQATLPQISSEETLTLVCTPRDLTLDSAQIYQYHLTAQTWQTITDVVDFAMLYAMADDATAILQTLVFNEVDAPDSEIVLWEGESQLTIKTNK